MAKKQSILEVVIDPAKAKKGSKEASAAYAKFAEDFDKHTAKIQSSFNKFVKATQSSNGRMLSKMRASWVRASSFIVNKGIKPLVSAMISGFKKATGAVLKLTAILGPLGLLGSLLAIVKAGLLIQKFSVTFSVITGSLKNARNEVQGLIQVSKKLGVAFDAASAPFAKFFAAAKDSMTSADIRGIFEAFAEVSVALHLNKQEVTGVFLALQQIASKGRVSMEELRLQLAERVPGAMRLAAKSMGQDMEEFEESVRKGTTNASEFLVNFGRLLHKEFGPAAAEASKLGQAAINRFTMSITLFLNKISRTGVLDSFIKLVDILRIKFFESNELAQVIGVAITKVVDKVTEFVSQLTDKNISQAVVAVANGFVWIYNTIIDVIPSLDTVVTAVKKIAKLAEKIGEFLFDDKQVSQTDKLKNSLELLNVELSKSRIFLTDDQRKIAGVRGIEELERLIRSTKEETKALVIEINNMAPALKKMDMFSIEDFLGGPSDKGIPSVGDASQVGESQFQKHLQRITDQRQVSSALIADAAAMDQEMISRHLNANLKLMEAREVLNEARINMDKFAAQTVIDRNPADINLGPILIAGDKLVVATKAFIKARSEFERLNDIQQRRITSGITQFAQDAIAADAEFLSMGNTVLLEKLDERRNIIEEARARGIIADAEGKELLEVMMLQHQSNLGSIEADGILARKRFENATNKQRVDTLMADMLSQTGRVAGFNKKMFEINKKFRLAQAIMELPGAVQTSFANGGGAPWGFIPAGITLAAGLANIQQIRSSTFSGGGGGGGGASGGGASTSPTPIEIPSQTDAIFNATNLGQTQQTVDSSPLTVNFDIQAVDATGIDRLISQRRDQIVSMIQSAYEERGRTGGPVQ